MDPDTALQNLYAAVRRAERYQDEDTDAAGFCVVPNGTVSDIIDAFDALDGWLKNGGFLPFRWNHVTRP